MIWTQKHPFRSLKPHGVLGMDWALPCASYQLMKAAVK